MKTPSYRTVLDEIVQRAKERVAADKSRVPINELQRRIADAPPVVSFLRSLKSGFGLIAEIKKRSPSQGPMRNQGVAEITRIYHDHPVVKAISMLTNRDDFAMEIGDLWAARNVTTKPILRKDFIFDEYQVYEARAYGADAILLMASVVTDPTQMRRLFELSQSLGMDVLFECRSQAEIEAIPAAAQIFGINSRKLRARTVLGVNRYVISRVLRHLHIADRSVEPNSFDLVRHIPRPAIKVAESGLSPHEIAPVRDHYGYNAALVGTAILNAQEGVEHALNAFSSALQRRSLEVPASERDRHGLAV